MTLCTEGAHEHVQATGPLQRRPSVLGELLPFLLPLRPGFGRKEGSVDLGYPPIDASHTLPLCLPSASLLPATVLFPHFLI